MSNYNLKGISKNIFWGIVLVTFIYLLSSIDKQVLETVASRLGWAGPVFIGLVLVSTQVFAPLSGSAFFFLAIRLYGYELTVVLFYISSMISSVICFFIARKWGRRLVIKLVGEKTMDKIDEISLTHEKTLLIAGRTLGYYFFDFISYALGLTKISFKKYMSYTVVLTLLPSFLMYFVFKDLNFDSFKNTLMFYGVILLTGIIFAILFSRIVKKSKNQ